MEERHRPALGRSTLWLVASRMATQGALVLFSVVVARRLGAAGFGEYAFVASILFIANVLTSFGTDMLLVREVAARRGSALASPALVLQLALSIAILVLGALVAPVLPGQRPVVVTALRVGLLTLLPLAPYTVLSAMLRGGAHMRAYATLSAAAALTQLVAVLVAVPAGSSVLRVALVLVATQGFAVAAALVACRASGVDLSVLASDPRPRLRALVEASAPIGVLGILGMLYQRAGVIAVSTIAGPVATGFFSAGVRTVEAAKTIHVAAWGALYPTFAEESASGGTSGRSVAPMSLGALVALAVTAATALTLLADPLVAIAFGASFAPAAAAVRILAWVLVPYTLSSHRSLELVATGREREVARALVLAVVTLAVLGALAIRSSGIAGASAVILAAECVQALALVAPWQAIAPAPRRRAAGSRP